MEDDFEICPAHRPWSEVLGSTFPPGTMVLVVDSLSDKYNISGVVDRCDVNEGDVLVIFLDEREPRWFLPSALRRIQQ